MKMSVIGKSERRMGTAKSSGKPYDGTTLHCVLAKSKDVAEGQAVKEIYLNHLSNIAFPTVSVGDVIDVEYDDKGYIDGIEVVKSSASKPAGFPPASPAKS